jgi:hypothetical protein
MPEKQTTRLARRVRLAGNSEAIVAKLSRELAAEFGLGYSAQAPSCFPIGGANGSTWNIRTVISTGSPKKTPFPLTAGAVSRNKAL